MGRAGSPRGLSPFRRGPTSNAPKGVDTPVIPLSEARRKYQPLRLIAPEDAQVSGLSRDDLQALDDIWGALLDRQRLSNERATEVFDHLLGWVLPPGEEVAS